MVTKWDFLEMEASLWLNGRSQNVAKGCLSTECCLEAAVHTLDLSWKKMDVKLMMMMMMMNTNKQTSNNFTLHMRIDKFVPWHFSRKLALTEFCVGKQYRPIPAIFINTGASL